MSLPAPPTRTSAPSPPVRVSLPAAPRSIVPVAFEVRTSAFAVPTIRTVSASACTGTTTASSRIRKALPNSSVYVSPNAPATGSLMPYLLVMRAISATVNVPPPERLAVVVESCKLPLLASISGLICRVIESMLRVARDINSPASVTPSLSASFQTRKDAKMESNASMTPSELSSNAPSAVMPVEFSLVCAENSSEISSMTPFELKSTTRNPSSASTHAVCSA